MSKAVLNDENDFFNWFLILEIVFKCWKLKKYAKIDMCKMLIINYDIQKLKNTCWN